MLALEQKSIVEQLVAIYEKDEWWHVTRMSHDEAILYHRIRLDNGKIVVYLDKGEVLGYYEREIRGNECYLLNVFIKSNARRGEVWKFLYKYFFATLPKGVTKVSGDKQKIGGKHIERIITKERKGGYDKNDN
jgi:hypothetical protein